MESKVALTKTSTWTKTSSVGFIWGIAEWSDGTIVLSDAERHTICNLVPPSTVTIVAGNGHAGFLDGVGDKVMFNTPKGIALTQNAEVLVADSSNHRIRQMSSDGTTITVSGTGKRGNADGPAKMATWDLPVEIAHISSGPSEYRILVASFSSPYLRCIHEGYVTTLTSPTSAASLASSSALGNGAALASPGLGPRKNSNLGVSGSSAGIGNGKILSAELQSPIFSFVREVGSSHLSSLMGKLEDRLLNGSSTLLDGKLEDACFKSLNAMASNNRGDLIVMDCGNHAIRLITIEGKVTTLAGNGFPGHQDGIITQTRLSFPRTMIVTRQGDVLVADTGNCSLRRIELAGSVRPLWVPTNPKPRHFNFLIPTEKSNPNAPAWSDLLWGTSNAGTWRLHRCILFARCPSLVLDASIQSKFLDLRISMQGFAAFWEFVYNDSFPLCKGDLASTILLIELIVIFQCVQNASAFEYSSWVLAHIIDHLPSVEEIVALVPPLVNLKLIESLKMCIRILSRRTDNPKLDDAMRQVHLMVTALDDFPDFHQWLKKRSSSMSSGFSKKIPEKCPTYPFGLMERDLSTLLHRDESTGRIRFPDMALKVAVDQLSCHRAILYKKWPLLTQYIEGSTMDKLPLVVTLPKECADMRISSLYGLLWYFYTGTLDKLKESEECTDIARVYEHLGIDDQRLKAHIYQTGFIDLATQETPNLWVQPSEPPASSCSIS